jgi:hypothetical protein
MVVHSYNSSTGEAEAGSQPGCTIKTLSEKRTEKEKHIYRIVSEH